MKVSDVGLLKFGNTVQMTGAIYQGEGRTFLLALPGEQLGQNPIPLEVDNWEELLRQTDLMETEIDQEVEKGVVRKAIVRKSTRQIEQTVSWRVFKRDQYRCRYCGADNIPLTVDHVITWEAGGPSVEMNLVATDKRCNRQRGNMPYEEWLKSAYYQGVSRKLSPAARAQNEALVAQLPLIPRNFKVRAR